MKKAWFSILFLCFARAASAFYPWGWQGWLQTVPTISDAATSGAFVGSVVVAQDTQDLYEWTGSIWEIVAGPNTGTVTSFAFTNANGFSGSVTNATTTPDLTLSTTVTGIVKGNGTALSAAVSDVDYQAPITLTTTGTSGAATFISNTLNIPNYSTAPGGSNTDVQFNNSGAFGGSGSLTWNGSALTSAQYIDSGLTASTPLYANGSKQLTSGTFSGNTTEFATVGASSAAGCSEFDSNGNLTSTGSACPTGTVTAVSVASANGFAGTSSGGSTPALTLETTITGLLHGNGTAISAETVSSPLLESAGTLSCQTASGTQAGCLSSANWTTFNNKQSALTFSDSISDSGGTVTLVNDSASPTASQYYGTNASSVLGYYNLPTGFTNPMTTLGDMIYENSTPAAARLAGSTSSSLAVLTQTGNGTISAAPTWSTSPALNGSNITSLNGSNVASGAVGAAYGGTGINTSSSTGCPLISSGTWSVSSLLSCFQQLFETVATTTGDLIYGGASGVPTRLAGNTSTTAQVLTSQGTGSAANAPSWQSLSAIGISTDWTSCDTLTIGATTTAPTKGTVVEDQCRWRRVGDSMEFHYTYYQSGAGSAGSGTYLLPLPNGVTMDTTKALAGAAGTGVDATALGVAYISSTGTVNTNGMTYGFVSAYDSQHLQVNGNTNTIYQGENWSSSWFGLNGANVEVSFDATIPIVGWSSNTIGGVGGYMPFSTGSLTSLPSNDIVGSGLTSAAETIKTITAQASNFTCSSNPTLTLYDCGTTSTSCTSGTSIGSVTLTAANTITVPSVTAYSLAISHYWAWIITAGTCTVLNATGTAGF